MMNRKGIVFSSDAIYAVAAIMIIFSAVLVLEHIGETDNAQTASLYTRAADSATINFYKGQNTIETADTSLPSTACKEVLGFNNSTGIVSIVGRDCQ